MTALAKHRHFIAALALVGFAAGCTGDTADQLFVQPGRFDYFSCSELVSARQKSAAREQELKTLIDRAEKESVGVLLAVASYRGEYLRAQAEQKTLGEVMERKKCPPDTPPRAPSNPSRRSR